MKRLDRVTRWLHERILDQVALQRAPDVVIGGNESPYLLRWWIVPRNRFLNVYYHQFLRSDDDRALHDHPWFWCSILLAGEYAEHTIAAGGVHRRRTYTAGSLRVRSPWFAHRIEVGDRGCCTLFITGPTLRAWGFHCPAGWRHWRLFTDPATDGRTTGKGCEK